MKNFLALIVTVAIAMVLFVGCEKKSGDSVGAENETPMLEFKLAENQSAGNPITEGMMKFAELVKEKTNGSVTIEVYTDGQLGQEVETITQVQADTLDFARVNTSSLLATAPEVAIFALPYIFANMDHKYEVLDGDVGQAVVDSLIEYNMVGLEFWEAGSRNFYTTEKPITKLADLKGMKIRVQPSEVAIKMVELLGGVPTPMNYGEVFQGLQTGVIDGAENDFVSYYTSGHYEAAKNFTLDGHMAPPAIVICSQKAWDKMNAEQQTAVREAAKEAAIWQRQAMNDFQNESRAKVEEAGSVIYDVDVTEFQEAVAPMYDLYPEFADQIKAIQALQ